MSQKLKTVVCLFLIFCVYLICADFSYAQTQKQDHDWVWNILVIPPQGGWEKEPGKSIRTALSWCEREISESSNGIGGHDVKFVSAPAPVSCEISVQDINLSIDSETIAVFSFSFSPEVDRVLVSRMSGRNIPLILAGGENVLIDRGGRPIRNIFALDMYRDYRAAAFALYAKKIYPSEKRIALAASRFTVNSYEMMSEEIESFEGDKAGVVISFMGSMGAREIWRNFMRLRTLWRLWNCAEPDKTYLSCRGMIFADQNIMLKNVGGFIETKRLLWRTRAMPIDDTVASGRAVTLYEWLKRAVELMPQPVDIMPRDLLLRNLERVHEIPFGNQKLTITPELHRPSERDVFIVEVRNHEFEFVDEVKTRGLVYVPAY